MGNKQNTFQVSLWTTFLVLIWRTILVDADTKEQDLKLVCYYSNWAIYRPSLAKFTPENINPYLCTHLIYAFAGMNKDYELKPFDSWNDIQQGNYKKFVNLKTYNHKLKLLIAVGGWNEGSKRFSKMVESSRNRVKFVRGAVSFLRKHGFDGLDLDWEYPGFRDGGQDEDKEGYAKLVSELREAFDSESLPRGKHRLLLTMAVPAGQQYIDKGYDIPVLNKNLDFFNLLTYDYHTSTEPVINHHAPLEERPGLEDWDPNRQYNIKWTVDYYIKKGADRKKLVVGIPTYGRSFTLQEPGVTDLGSAADGPGEKGSSTREKGYLSYYEICQKIQDEEWELDAPYPKLMGPYAFKDNQWVGFDDEDIIIEKVKFILQERLGGGMVWTLDNDDFRGTCYGEQSPLINTLKNALFGDSDASEHVPGTTALSKSVVTQKTPRQRQRSTATPRVDPPKKSTAERFTTPDPGPPFECEDEGFFNNPADCKKYFWCLDSGPSNLGLVPHSFTCPSGLLFNKKKDSCDYAGNVVCRIKTTPATTTTPRPRPRPRKTTTTTTTTPTTTEKPVVKLEIPKEIQNDLSVLNGPLNAIKLNSESLTELLQLLQNLGVNKIQEAKQASDSLPEYRSPNRRRTTSSPVNSDFLISYAKPERPDSGEPTTTVRPRGPQYRAANRKNNQDSSEDDIDDVKSEERNLEFPFVYQTPSRTRTTKDPVNSRETDEDDYDSDDYVTQKPSKQSDNRRTEIYATPPPRRRSQNPREMAHSISDDVSENRGNGNYVLAQTVGVRRVARPVNENDDSLSEQSPTEKPSPPKRRFRQRARQNKAETQDVSNVPAISQSVTKVRQSTTEKPFTYYQVVVPTGRPAIPAPTRRPTPHLHETREPALALLPDGGITCLKRGVYPHPMDCAKFLVCVPVEGDSDEYDGFIHTCPLRTHYSETSGRCVPEDRAVCDRKRPN